MRSWQRLVVLVLLCSVFTTSAWPWGNEGHMAINRAAALSLPSGMPAFLKNSADYIAYLGPEPDRWREKMELTLKLAQEPDHFIDLERVEGMTLPPDRYSFYRDLYSKREQMPEHPDTLLPEKVGLQPYATIEVYERLVVAFREYRHALRDGKSPEFAERDAAFYAGWLGHYVADGANPLHTTVNYNGWTGPNPNGYTTANNVHWKIEGPFIAANLKSLSFDDLMTGPPRKLDKPFDDYMAYLRNSNTLVEKCYQLEKAGGFENAGTPQSREFIRQRMAAGAQMLRDMWYTAWMDSAVDPPPYVPPKPTTSTVPAAAQPETPKK